MELLPLGRVLVAGVRSALGSLTGIVGLCASVSIEDLARANLELRTVHMAIADLFK